jgi:hypothetical protein
VSIGSIVTGGQQQASMAVSAESIEDDFYRREEHYASANEGCVLCGEAVMIETMQGKIASLCAEIRGVKRDQVQVCSIRLEVIAGVGVQFIGSQELFAPEHVIGMHKTVEFRLCFPVKLGLGTGTM